MDKDLIVTVLDNLAQKLDVKCGMLWEILVGQAYISGFIGIGYCMFVVVCWVGLYFAHRNLMGKGRTSRLKYNDWDGYIGVMVFAGVVLLIITLVTIASMGDIVTKITMPEYHALQNILSAFKPRSCE